MSGIKKLAGQTVWYGASSIFARFLNYLLTPYLTFIFRGTVEYGRMSLVYSIIPFLYTIFLFGFETTYFRYVQKKEYKEEVYNTLFSSIITSTTFFAFLLILFHQQVANFIGLGDHPMYIILATFIIAFDTLSALPFARIRQENRPRKFALIKVIGIFANIGTIYFFLSVCPALRDKHPDSIFLVLYNKDFGAGYVLIGNVVQSLVQIIGSYREIRLFRWRFNLRMWKELVVYSLPLMVAGFAGMINETFDRIMLQWWSPAGSHDAAMYQVGIYNACYKLSIVISLFVQAFRMGAEPFFFRQSEEDNAPRTYARVMKFFVITISVMFLLVALFLNIWKGFIKDPNMWEGLKVVPILLFANMFLGIYYSLSIWYKLSAKTTAGIYITLAGVVITLAINAIFIPYYSYMACAWATFCCYGTMMVISFVWGQKVYRIPYAWKKLVAYLVIVALLYFLHHFLTGLWTSYWFSILLGATLTLAYVVFLLKVERKEFHRLPVIGKYL